MESPKSEILKKRYGSLAEIYADIPVVSCAGRCAAACTLIPMSNVERTRIRAAGVVIPLITEDLVRSGKLDYVCPALVEKRCSVYAARPVICRLYGGTEDLPCPFGCAVDRPKLTVDEAHHLLNEARRLGNGSTVRPNRKS